MFLQIVALKYSSRVPVGAGAASALQVLEASLPSWGVSQKKQSGLAAQSS